MEVSCHAGCRPQRRTFMPHAWNLPTADVVYERTGFVQFFAVMILSGPRRLPGEQLPGREAHGPAFLNHA